MRDEEMLQGVSPALCERIEERVASPRWYWSADGILLHAFERAMVAEATRNMFVANRVSVERRVFDRRIRFLGHTERCS